MLLLFLLLMLVPPADSFSPCSLNTNAIRPSTSLCMNKKKPRTSNSKGFGSTSKSSSSTQKSTATLIQPKIPKSFQYAGSIRAEQQSPRRYVPDTIMFPDYALDGIPKAKGAMFPWIIDVKKEEEIEKMRVAGRLAREVLDLAGKAVKAGVTT